MCKFFLFRQDNKNTTSLHRPKSGSHTLKHQTTTSTTSNGYSRQVSSRNSDGHSTDGGRMRKTDRPRSVSSGNGSRPHSTSSQRPRLWHRPSSSVSHTGGSDYARTIRQTTNADNSRRPSSSRSAIQSAGGLRRVNSEERIRDTVCIYTGSNRLLHQQKQQQYKQQQQQRFKEEEKQSGQGLFSLYFFSFLHSSKHIISISHGVTPVRTQSCFEV